MVFGPLDGVRGQTGFSFVETLLVALKDPMGAGGFKDQRGGGGVLGIVGGGLALEGELPFGAVFEGQDGSLEAAAVGEAVHRGAGFAVGGDGAGGAIRLFVAGKIFFGVVHGARVFRTECRAGRAGVRGGNGEKVLIYEGMGLFCQAVTECGEMAGG
ncbi:MAG TPA: hypothetical protein VMF91_15780 [Bryobacteraceae bacterium]|nr:hypothetical protein [Bryobacteraceae bacterium]